MIKAGPVHEVLQTNSVGEPVYASPAIANGTIYIRGDKHLFAIADMGKQEMTVVTAGDGARAARTSA